MDVERSTDPQRLIEIRVLDNQGTGDINEARTVAKIKVDITSVDDKPVLLVNNFNRVQLVQKTVTEIVDDEEVEITGLRVESTQLLPVSLLDQPGVNALSNSSFGVSSEGMIFDPDSMINEISIEIVSSEASTLELAEQQDKLLFNKSIDNNFEIVGDQGNSTLTLSLSQDIIDGQTNAENQAMVEQTLRSIYYENDKPLSEIISGFRDVKLLLKTQMIYLQLFMTRQMHLSFQRF